MTTPEERAKAREEANEALERAEETRQAALKLAQAWRRSRADNNFRQMLRQLATGSE